jgi:hypothetical protein
MHAVRPSTTFRFQEACGQRRSVLRAAADSVQLKFCISDLTEPTDGTFHTSRDNQSFAPTEKNNKAANVDSFSMKKRKN